MPLGHQASEAPKMPRLSAPPTRGCHKICSELNWQFINIWRFAFAESSTDLLNLLKYKLPTAAATSSPTYCPILSVYTHIHTFSWSSFINMVNKLRIPWTSKSLLIFLTLLGPVKNKGETYVFIFNYTHSTQWGIYVFIRVSVGALVTLLFHSLPFLLVNQNLVFITKGHKNCKVNCKN